MLFEKSLQEGYAKRIAKDELRAKSLMKTAEDALRSVKDLPLHPYNYNTILRELYEALRQYCEALGYLQGYKFSSHESITYFLKEIVRDDHLSLRFDQYRKLRNDLNYYGRAISQETIQKALIEVPRMIDTVRKLIK